ncbi:4-(cytidine 5'-diphospho)-2-C-methyl-D-erythritol kinase [Candidatus Ichthyocystis sparus]|uniref:4-(cytidine 5'-diphospho)-2-C-methyl-D-erythritol kinase n=2 Tax=Candidatus Ichthyocystis sparus TaxID=1561004 RepID=UPI000B2AF63E|nr:4-(cytidine 5'-diphospho)-2-C-methyl-D-erythritol kinase [Candidatus Ichthyocystis sparus]
MILHRQYLAKWWAPAKINLFLNLICKRPDNYHELQTAFANITLCDTLNFVVTDDKKLHLETRGLSVDCADRDNLVWRAAEYLKSTAKVKNGCRIILNKAIPSGSGLAGGSSDAATTLIALNILWKTHIPNQQLQEIGAKLGQDVPFFIAGKPSWGIEKGGLIKIPPTGIRVPPYCILLMPPISVLSSKIYDKLPITTKGIRYELFDKESYHHGNDMEEIVINNHPEVGKAKAWLGRWGRAQITGSGSCVFCLLNNIETALEVVKNSKTHRLGKIYLTKTLVQHPHYHLANNY